MAERLLVDTDVLIDYLRDVDEAVTYVESVADSLVISAVTVAELFAGVREGKERRALERFLGAFEVLPLDGETAVRGGLMRRDYGKSHGVGLVDAVVAASGEKAGAAVVTLNAKPFPMIKNVVAPYRKG